MSLKKIADHLAAHGRHGDTELVHVSKDELKTMHGLASLGGTGLTTNPRTGLPEAFSLGSLFKTVAPIAAGVGGSLVGMPWLGALAAGAMTTADTGSLQKGLMAGLGSYAMGGLGSAALGAGGTALANTAAGAATQAGSQAAADAAAQGVTQGATQGAAQSAGDLAGQMSAGDISALAQQGAAQQAAAGGIGGMPDAMQASLGKSFPNLSADQLAQVTSEGTPDLMAQRAAMLNQFGQANYSMSPAGAVTQAPQIGGQFNPSWSDKLGALGMGDYAKIAADNPAMALGAAAGAMNALTPTPSVPGQEKDDSALSRAHLAPDYYTRNSVRFATGGLASLSPKFACGGPVAFDSGGPIEQTSSMNNKDFYPQANVDQSVYSQPTQEPMQRSVLRAGYEQPTDPSTGDQLFAAGGLASLGRPIQGPGDGMSDNVPATIEGTEPARLADGEYVVPADAVSHLGNGSTKAGVHKLDQMMARIRKARTGNPKQGRQINADKLMTQ